jgi:hypothetical protein
MERITIPLQTKRSLRGMLTQHALAGIALLSAVVTFITEEGNPYPWLMIVETALAVGLIIVIVMEFVRIREGKHFPFPIVDLLAGLVLSMESLNRFLEGRIRLAVAWLFVALLTIAVGFLRPRYRFFRSRVMPNRIILDAEGVDVRMTRWSRFRLAWEVIAFVEVSPVAIRFIPHQGTPRNINLSSIIHPEELVSRFAAAVRRLNLPPEKLRDFPDHASEG